MDGYVIRSRGDSQNVRRHSVNWFSRDARGDPATCRHPNAPASLCLRTETTDLTYLAVPSHIGRGGR